MPPSDHVLAALTARWDPTDAETIDRLVTWLAERWNARRVAVYGVPRDGWCDLVSVAEREVAPPEVGLLGWVRSVAEGMRGTPSAEGLDRPDPYDGHTGTPARVRQSVMEKAARSESGTLVVLLAVGAQDGGCLVVDQPEGWVRAEAQQVASFLGAAIWSWQQNRELERAVEASAAQADSAHEALHATMDMGSLVGLMLRQLARALRWDGGLVLRQRGDDFDVRYAEGVEPHLLDDPSLGRRLVVVETFGDQQLLLGGHPEDLAELGIGAVLVVPAPDGAVVLVARDVGRPAGPGVLHTVEAFVQQLSVVLQGEKQQQLFVEAYLRTVATTVAALELGTPRLRGHHEQVVSWATDIARGVSLPEDRVARVALAASIHDAGMLTAVEDPSLATTMAFQHPLIGASLLDPVPDTDDVATMVLEHHETYDGLGFPHGRSGDALGLEGQVLAAAEFAAERTTRSIGAASSLQELAALFEREAGHRFAPQVAAAAAAVAQARVGSRPSCRSFKGAPDGPCASCPAAASPSPCWELPASERACGSHGDDDCQACSVFRTWGPG